MERIRVSRSDAEVRRDAEKRMKREAENRGDLQTVCSHENHDISVFSASLRTSASLRETPVFLSSERLCGPLRRCVKLGFSDHCSSSLGRGVRSRPGRGPRADRGGRGLRAAGRFRGPDSPERTSAAGPSRPMIRRRGAGSSARLGAGRPVGFLGRGPALAGGAGRSSCFGARRAGAGAGPRRPRGPAGRGVPSGPSIIAGGGASAASTRGRGRVGGPPARDGAGRRPGPRAGPSASLWRGRRSACGPPCATAGRCFGPRAGPSASLWRGRRSACGPPRAPPASWVREVLAGGRGWGSRARTPTRPRRPCGAARPRASSAGGTRPAGGP